SFSPSSFAGVRAVPVKRGEGVGASSHPGDERSGRAWSATATAARQPNIRQGGRCVNAVGAAARRSDADRIDDEMEPAAPTAQEIASRHDDLTHVIARSIFGVGAGIASAVYGTVVVMATLTAAYANESDPWKLAEIVATTSFVLWIAHVYAHGLSRMITHSPLALHSVLAH